MAAKKFKGVNKQSRVYDGTTGLELTGDAHVPELEQPGAFVVLSSKAGWRGAARLQEQQQRRHCQQEQAAAAAAAAAEAAVEAVDRPPEPGVTAAMLREAAKSGRGDGVVLLWKDTQANGYLTNWARSPIVVRGEAYNCVEQWIMCSKAKACGNLEVSAKILGTRKPREQKAFGRSLDPKVVARCWTLREKWATQLQGARAKFGQSPDMALSLLRTGRKPIAEASPSDRIYGIGLAPSDRLAQDPQHWRGTNLLGRALMQVREELRERVRGLAAEGSLPSDLLAGLELVPLTLDGPGSADEEGAAEAAEGLVRDTPDLPSDEEEEEELEEEEEEEEGDGDSDQAEKETDGTARLRT